MGVGMEVSSLPSSCGWVLGTELPLPSQQVSLPGEPCLQPLIRTFSVKLGMEPLASHLCSAIEPYLQTDQDLGFGVGFMGNSLWSFY